MKIKFNPKFYRDPGFWCFVSLGFVYLTFHTKTTHWVTLLLWLLALVTMFKWKRTAKQERKDL